MVRSELSRWWLAVLTQGAEPVGTLRSRFIMGVNRYCAIATAAYAPVIAALLLQGHPEARRAGWIALAMPLAWVLSVWLNRLRLPLAAFLTAMLAPAAALTAVTAVMSHHAGFHLPLAAMTGLAFILLTPQQRWWRAVFALLSTVLLLAIYTMPAFAPPPPGLPMTAVRAFAAVNVLLVAMLAYIVAWFNSSYFLRERKRNERLLEAARAAAQTDSLTEVLNRRGITPIMSDAVRAGRYSLALADLDRFKRVNDRLGHGAGDVVLANVARSLVRAIDGEGVVGRWGGEEFVVVMAGTDLDRATAVMERARAAIERDYGSADTLDAVTLSAGVAHAARFTSKDEALRRADALLYEAKAAGRNRVCAGEVD